MSHSTKEKQDAIVEIVNLLCPDFTVAFDMSRRAKRLFGQVWHDDKKMKFYRPLFRYTIAACRRCALHEVAHALQEEISGYSRHDKQFGEILDMLIEDYGTPAIALAKKNTKLSSSKYEYDRD